jgi:glucose-1-phosphate cytidylyltransferase
MKAVLLAGGLGTRMREETEFRPKPMVEVGGRPVLWHIMKVLGQQGITDFVICTGYKSEYIKNYFYNYGATNLDFTVKLGDRSSTVFHGSHDEFDWTVTVAETGHDTNTGGRLKLIEKYLDGETFLATYGDGIADVDLKALLDFAQKNNTIGTITTARAEGRFGVVDINEHGLVEQFKEKPKLNEWVNIGYFVFQTKIFDFLEPNSILEEAPMRELASLGQLSGYKHEGFWQPMDTYKESQTLNELWSSGKAPWKIWN